MLIAHHTYSQEKVDLSFHFWDNHFAIWMIRPMFLIMSSGHTYDTSSEAFLNKLCEYFANVRATIKEAKS